MARSKTQRRSKKQRGGGDGAYGFHGAAFMTDGVPYATRDAWYNQCGWDLRQAPKIGGGCACAGAPLRGGGGAGTGGYSPILTSNLAIGYPVGYAVAPCPPAPRENPLRGGRLSDTNLVDAVAGGGAGYSQSQHDVYSSNSAHFLDKSAYSVGCAKQGGGSKRRSRRSRSHRQKKRR